MTMTGSESNAGPDVDPITVEVIGNALASIVEEMGETLVRAAYSTNVKERRVSSTCLFDARGRTLCQAMHIPMHLGSLMGVVEHVTARHPLAEIRPGDVFIGNDAYTGGGTHLPDIVMAEPVFLDGEVIAWATNIAHHADFVDRGHAHIYQEGLRIPPVKLYRAGAIQQDVLDLILLNCQVPRERLNDLRAQMASNRLGIQRFQSLIHGALAAAIPDRIIAACNGACVSSTFSGVDPRTGRFYVYLETIGGGSGARATKDGLDGVHVHITNTSNLPVEALEAEYPLVVERYALVEDSGGPGTWRGGLGLWRQIRAEGHECHAFVHGSRRLSAPWGLFGGRDGGRGRIVYSPGVPPPVRGQGFLGPGQSVAIITPGAGGYGDPRERDRALVRRDLAEGTISPAVARDAYGLADRP
jgi:N-methylhydantoinase B/oxoprolinase/acetone carboxylase alpha subunit